MSDEITTMLDTTRKELIFKMVRIGSKGLIDGLRSGERGPIAGGMATVSLASTLASKMAKQGVDFGGPETIEAMLKHQADLALAEDYTTEVMKAEMDWVTENIDAVMEGIWV